jgi:hypothetical protein
MEILDITGKLAVDDRAAGPWCTLPYPGHRHGCPNYGKRPECPPQAPKVREFIDLDRPHWFIVANIDLEDHMRRMKINNPTWSEAQLRCCLYWQRGVRKDLRRWCAEFVMEHPGTVFTLIPEAMGVNVFRTARRVKVPIMKTPAMVYKIALVGYTPRPRPKALEDFA